jgi:hypothetical protein
MSSSQNSDSELRQRTWKKSAGSDGYRQTVNYSKHQIRHLLNDYILLVLLGYNPYCEIFKRFLSLSLSLSLLTGLRSLCSNERDLDQQSQMRLNISTFFLFPQFE